MKYFIGRYKLIAHSLKAVKFSCRVEKFETKAAPLPKDILGTG